MYKAVVFDFDGLIFDTESVHTTIYQEMFDLYNLEFPFKEWIQNIGTKSNFTIYDLLEKEIEQIDRAQLKKMNKEKWDQDPRKHASWSGVFPFLFCGLAGAVLESRFTYFDKSKKSLIKTI